MATMASAATQDTVPGRVCGGCTMCCKLFAVQELAKPAGKWCPKCNPGRGCSIHGTAPAACRAFECLWLQVDWLGPEWRPDRLKCVITVDAATEAMMVHVDPGTPAAWRAEQVYGQLKVWAAAREQRNRYVVVWVNRHATVLLADRDVDLGHVPEGETIDLSRL